MPPRSALRAYFAKRGNVVCKVTRRIRAIMNLLMNHFMVY